MRDPEVPGEELHEREKQLIRAKDVAEAASRAKSAFLANMSHEIRTPMNAILGYTQLLQRDVGLSAGQRDYLEVIRRSGEHLLHLINDVLEVSKIEAGHRRLSSDDIDLNGLLDDLARMFQLRADAKRLGFQIHRAADLPQRIVGDEGKLRQVLVNLLANAVKFTEAGGITTRVRVRPPAEGARAWLLVEIEDTGPGIGSDEIDALFQPFRQARVGARMDGGTGLGLALSREFARLMGGDIAIESRVGKGSVFRLELPFEIGHAQAIERPVPRPGRVMGIAGLGPPPRILVVDDEDDNRSWLRQLLLQVGFDVREASDGQQAIAVFAGWLPRLVLMDMNMPILDGYLAARALRALPEGRSVAIVAVTASAFDEEREAIFEAGADGWLRKPCREADLLEEIRRHLGIEYRYATLRRTSSPTVPAVRATGNQPDPMGSLPSEIATSFRDAAHIADYGRLVELTAELPPEHAAAADELRRLIESFAYDKIEVALRR